MRIARSAWYSLIRSWRIVVAVGATMAAMALLWRVHDLPLDLAAGVRIDALSAFFTVLLLADLALALGMLGRAVGRALVVILLLVSLNTTLTPLLAGGYMLAALLMLVPSRQSVRDQPHTWWRQFASQLRSSPDRALWPIAALSLMLSYGTLALRGAVRYTDPTAGAALDSFVFWFALLAAVIPLLPFGPMRRGAGEASPLFDTRALGLAWCYPLLRLYSLGPWNTGWSLAAVLLGGALAGWCALSAFAEPGHQLSQARIRAGHVGLALAGIGLGTSAGIAAACFALLAQLVVALDRLQDREAVPADGGQPTASAFMAWLLAGIFPFTAPFVALWLLLSASIAAGVALLAGVVWLVGLLNGVALALWGSTVALRPHRMAITLASISLALGIGAPLVLRGAIQPIVAQLQGGLSPYGDIAIWPWVGLGANDAARGQVATMPSIAIALLMLVLAALVYVVGRLYALYTPAQPARPDAGGMADISHADMAARLQDLRAEVPWLALLLGARSKREDAPRERQ